MTDRAGKPDRGGENSHGRLGRSDIVHTPEKRAELTSTEAVLASTSENRFSDLESLLG
jgi:hypothetical protein